MSSPSETHDMVFLSWSLCLSPSTTVTIPTGTKPFRLIAKETCIAHDDSRTGGYISSFKLCCARRCSSLVTTGLLPDSISGVLITINVHVCQQRSCPLALLQQTGAMTCKTMTNLINDKLCNSKNTSFVNRLPSTGVGLG